MQRFRGLTVQIEQKIQRKGVFHLVSICISTMSFAKKFIVTLKDSMLPYELQHGLILHFPCGKQRFNAQQHFL